MDNRCVCCGEIIPEGRQVCPNCENGPMDIFDMGLSTRATRCLYRAGIRTAEELAKQSDQKLLNIRSFGVGCLAEVRAALVRFGYAKPVTNEDHIRAQIRAEEGLAKFLMKCHDDGIHIPFCQNKEECLELIEENGVPESKCMDCMIEWLRKEYGG